MREFFRRFKRAQAVPPSEPGLLQEPPAGAGSGTVAATEPATEQLPEDQEKRIYEAIREIGYVE